MRMVNALVQMYNCNIKYLYNYRTQSKDSKELFSFKGAVIWGLYSITFKTRQDMSEYESIRYI